MSDELAGDTPEEGTPVHDRALDALMASWSAGAPETIDVEGALARVNARRRAEATVTVDDLAARRARRAAPVATPLWRAPLFRAAAALIVVAGSLALWRSARGPAAPQTFATTMGVTKDLHLPDGTEVRLGPASSLELAAGYGRSTRRVTLHGEAWFKVVHNEAMPFAIRVGETTVEDVGTAFQVRESEGRRAVSVRVAEGAVRLTTTAASRDSSVMLKAGDGAVASSSGITVAVGAVSATETSALAAGRLTFADAPMSEVQESLQRWYGVTLVMSDSTLANRHVTADFTGEPIERVRAVIGLTLGATATQRGDTIALRAGTGVQSRP